MYFLFLIQVIVNNFNYDYVKQQIKKLLFRAVNKRLNADRPIGFLLSGGLDSSLILAIAAKLLKPENIVCFSIGLPGSQDIIAAQEVVEFLGVKNHHVVNFTLQEAFDTIPDVIRDIGSYDVTTIRASVPQYLLAKYISENTDVKVLLSGEGSDEIHGSYRYFRDAPDNVSFDNDRSRLLNNLYHFDNLRTDRTMASHGLEVRVPFLDFKYVEFIMSLSGEYFRHSREKMEKLIIRESFDKILPDNILFRSKEAFSDAVSNNTENWAEYIKSRAADLIHDNDQIYLFNPPQSVDAIYFRKIFDNYYPGCDNIIPYYWLPRFQKTIVTDPSATILECY